MLPDIIIYLLEIFLKEKDARSILVCMQLNKLWNSIIVSNPNKYLRTPEMMSCLLTHEKFREKFTNDFLQIIVESKFHRILTAKLKMKMEVSKSLFKYLPNYKTNFMITSKEYSRSLEKKLIIFIKRFIEFDNL